MDTRTETIDGITYTFRRMSPLQYHQYAVLHSNGGSSEQGHDPTEAGASFFRNIKLQEYMHDEVIPAVVVKVEMTADGDPIKLERRTGKPCVTADPDKPGLFLGDVGHSTFIALHGAIVAFTQEKDATFRDGGEDAAEGEGQPVPAGKGAED